MGFVVRVVLVGVGVAWAFAFAGDGAAGQAVYKWTDERGVVHFSDVAPPAGTKYQVRDLPPPPPPPPPPPAAEAAVDAGGGAAAPAGERSGPALVEIVEQEEAAAGDDTHEYRGKVKNVGGATASDVVVLVSVTETNQGAECLDEEVEVEPANLAPGETGTYSTQFSNPCFLGPTRTSIKPDWR
jgi:hypothetical protein